ncbi:MAG: head decoration protein [Paracoccus sp. (in: a-proteobacteria)]|uniref:head decoration protein n=1 Tax=Paracoccus sp. TaxID=267 RepID=UPI004059716F
MTVSGQYTFASHGGSDGAETAAGILLYPVDTRLSEATGILLARGPAILSRDALFYDGSVMTRPRSPPNMRTDRAGHRHP